LRLDGIVGGLSMNRKKGFTLIELFMAILISSVLILMVGALSQIAFSSHDQVRKEGDLYSDLFYGFNLLTYSVRNALTVEVLVDELNNTKGLNLANSAYNRTFGNNNTSFQYTDSTGVYNIIDGVSNLNFDFRCEKDIVTGNWLADSCSASSKIFHLILTGSKDNEPFDLVSDVMRRN